MAQTIEQTMTTRHYRGPAQAGAPRLAGLPGVRHEEIVPRQVLETERHDTDDRRLTAAGITLAVRRGDGDHWQLALPEPAERLRVAIPDGAPDPAPLPGDLDELLRATTRGRAVRPCGRVRRVRDTTRLLDGHGSLLAEVVHDEVTIATLGASTDVEAWTEAELRPAAADPDLVTALAARLAEDGLRPAPRGAEDELDLRLRPATRRPTAGRPSSAGAVLMAYLGAQVDRLASADRSVRRDEPDAVHRMRVAARRLRSALQAYRPLLDRTHSDALVDGLRTFGRELAPARDAEVLRERIDSGLDAMPPELRLGPVQAQVTRHFARVEAEARAAVLTELDGERYAALRADLDALLDRPPLTGRAARPARRAVPVAVARTGDRLERAVAVAVDPEAPAAERDAAVHAARKAGKRLRYATEVGRPVLGKKKAKRSVARLAAFQKALGEHQDTVVARAALRELGATGENGFSFGVLHGQDAARAARIEAELPKLWAAARHR